MNTAVAGLKNLGMMVGGIVVTNPEDSLCTGQGRVLNDSLDPTDELSEAIDEWYRQAQR